MKKLIFTFTMALCCAATVNIIAQENNSTPKEKTITTKDGKTVTGVKTITIDAENSSEWIKKNLDGKTKKVWIDENEGAMTLTADQIALLPNDDQSPENKKVSVNIEKEIVDGEVKRTVTVDIDEDGQQEKIKWTDNGAIPDEIKSILDEKGISMALVDGNGKSGEEIEITIDDTNKLKTPQKKIIKKEISKAVKIKMIDDTGEEKVIEWDGNGAMPAEMKEIMKEHDVDNILEEIHEEDINGRSKKIKKRTVIKSHAHEGNGNKAMLGVQIMDEGEGVTIQDVFKNTGAQKAGLKEGDMINSVNGQLVTNIEALITNLKGTSPGDIVNLGILRAGKQQVIDVSMSAMDTKINIEK